MRRENRRGISEQLLDAIEDRQLSAYAVAKLAGVDQGTIAKWMKGRKDLLFATAAAIAEGLDLEWTERRGRGRPAITPRVSTKAAPRKSRAASAEAESIEDPETDGE